MGRKYHEIYVMPWGGLSKEVGCKMAADQGLGMGLQGTERNSVKERREECIDVESGLLIVFSSVPDDTANFRHSSQLQVRKTAQDGGIDCGVADNRSLRTSGLQHS